MAKHRKAKLTTNGHVEDEDLMPHIRSLGLQTVEAYRGWCRDHGFSRKLLKSEPQRQQEYAYVQRTLMASRLKSERQQRRDPLSALLAICDEQLPIDEITHGHLYRFGTLVSRQGPQQHGEFPIDREALKQLLTHLSKVRSKLFDGSPVIPSLGHAEGNSLIEALVMVAAHQSSWLRPLGAWRPRSKNARRQFSDLVRHLFVHYDMPPFFDSVWFSGRKPIAGQARAWYIHMGRGGSLRDCGLPIPYTKRMAHFFMQAPHHATIAQAIRWGQVLGLGGDARLATALLGTRLGERFDHDDFWITVVRWFIAHPMVDTAHVNPIVDYLYHQRFELVDMQVDGRWERRPRHPNLTMHGRTPAAMLRQVNAWHDLLSHHPLSHVEQWRAAGWGGLCLTEGQAGTASWRQWRIRELLTPKALVAEGQAMQHCVGSYVGSCVRGRSSIWTLEQQSLGGLEKCVTIEVTPADRVICQIRGRRNRLATEQEMRVVRHWAERADLHLAGYMM